MIEDIGPNRPTGHKSHLHDPWPGSRECDACGGFGISVEDALDFARVAHGDQRYGGNPYVYHLAQVHDLLIQHAARASVDLDDEVRVAAILHDVLEDTKVTRAELVARYGEPVGLLVWAVTKDQGRNRREKNELCLPRIPTVPGAVLVKLADTNCNVESCWATKDSRLFMYHREYPFFRKTLYRTTAWGARTDLARLEGALWTRLDELLGWRDRG